MCQPYYMQSLTTGGTSGRVHLKIQWLWRLWQKVLLECLEQDVASKEVLVIHCSLAGSHHNGSLCHWIKTSQAERVGFSLCTGLLTIKLLRTVLQLITDYWSVYTHLQVLWWWARGKSNRCRWALAVVITNLHVGSPWASGHSFSWIQGQQGSSTAPVGNWAASLGQHCSPLHEKVPQTNACPSSVWSAYHGWQTHPYSSQTTMQRRKHKRIAS